MSGKTIADCGLRIADLSGGKPLRLTSDSAHARKISNPQSAIRNAAGFSLLELMIAMFILIILLSIAVPTYQRSVQHAKETVLKENLWQMRKAIDQYASDKGKLPKTVDDLVEGKYLREKPHDPITDEETWDEKQDKDPLSPDGDTGLVDVKSLAQGQDSDGKKYTDY